MIFRIVNKYIITARLRREKPIHAVRLNDAVTLRFIQNRINCIFKLHRFGIFAFNQLFDFTFKSQMVTEQHLHVHIGHHMTYWIISKNMTIQIRWH
ncbi:hypothetical protein D3C73_1459990 [compost metagenome]